jgi:hypothetical protein
MPSRDPMSLVVPSPSDSVLILPTVDLLLTLLDGNYRCKRFYYAMAGGFRGEDIKRERESSTREVSNSGELREWESSTTEVRNTRPRCG